MRKLIGTKPISTVGELKEALAGVPDNYSLTCMGTEFAIAMDTKDEFVLMDEINFIDEMLAEEEM